MKLVINYDLLDKAKESVSGFSLNRFRNQVLRYTAMNTVLGSISNMAVNAPIETYFFDIICYLVAHSTISGTTMSIMKKYFKERALLEMGILSSKLRDIYVDTDPELLTEAYKYKTEYSVNFEHSIIPRIEQRKYLIVPVHSDWDNNTRSLVQEHIIGSKEYALSHGEPEKKVLTLGQRQYAKK